MAWGKKRRALEAPQVHHPDPAVEQRLEYIRMLRRMVRSCEAQITGYQDAIKSAHMQDSAALTSYNHGTIGHASMRSMIEVNAKRRKEAEASITAQRAEARRLNDEVLEKTAVMDPSDLSFL